MGLYCSSKMGKIEEDIKVGVGVGVREEGGKDEEVFWLKLGKYGG